MKTDQEIPCSEKSCNESNSFLIEIDIVIKPAF